MDTFMRSSAQIGPTPVWSLTNAARDIDSFVAGLPTALLEALLKIEQDALAGRRPILATR
jgi:hypothetical protein